MTKLKNLVLNSANQKTLTRQRLTSHWEFYFHFYKTCLYTSPLVVFRRDASHFNPAQTSFCKPVLLHISLSTADWSKTHFTVLCSTQCNTLYSMSMCLYWCRTVSNKLVILFMAFYFLLCHVAFRIFRIPDTALPKDCCWWTNRVSTKSERVPTKRTTCLTSVVIICSTVTWTVQNL